MFREPSFSRTGLPSGRQTGNVFGGIQGYNGGNVKKMEDEMEFGLTKGLIGIMTSMMVLARDPLAKEHLEILVSFRVYS